MPVSFLDAAQKGKHSWWRYLLGLAFIFFFWFGLGGAGTLVVARLVGLSAEQMAGLSLTESMWQIPPVSAYLVISVSFVFLLIGILLAVVLIHRRPARSLITGRNRVNWLRVLQGLAVWFVMAAVVTLVEAVLEPSAFSVTLDLKIFLPFVVLALILTPIQTSSEELFFRGYLVQGASLLSKNHVFLAIFSGLLFTLPHLANPEVKTNFWLVVPYFFLLGSFLAWISLKDGTLELALGIHAANNLFAGMVVNYAESALPAPSIFLSTRLNPAYNLVSAFLMMGLFYLIFFVLAKHQRG